MLEFEDFIMDCQLRPLPKATIKTYKVGITNFIKYIKEERSIDRISKIKTNHVKAYLLFKSSNCSEGYINNIIKALKVFFNYCIKEEYIIKNPMYKIAF